MDYQEPVKDVMRRLRQEHKEIGQKLRRVSPIVGNENGNLKVAVSLLKSISAEILRHTVEEEARLARIIMQSSKTRKASDKSLRILQEHRRIKEFIDDELPYLLDGNSEKEARKKIIGFVDIVLEHHADEEREVFPLAFRAIHDPLLQSVK